VTAGTIFHRSRTPLRMWFAAAWLMTSQKQGISALGVQRVLGLGSYQTAWAMLHRFRVAMVRPGRERLGGLVEVDEGYIGGVEGGVDGRQTDTKSIVAIAVEIEKPKGFGRIRLQRVPDVSKDSLIPFIEGAVEPGATVRTDGWQAYWTVSEHG
jgi:ISXO2-like transposase domain